MTREEAIKWLIKPTVTSTEVSPTKAKELEAYNMAIEALQAETVQGVGRYENAIQKLREMPKYLNSIKTKQIKKISTEIVQGEWRKTENDEMEITGYYCSVCDTPTDELTYFCPNCGAYMGDDIE